MTTRLSTEMTGRRINDRKLRMLLAVSATAALAAAVGLTWIHRGSYDTFVSRDLGNGHALRITYPSDWMITCNEMGDVELGVPYPSVCFCRRSHSGLQGWVEQQILHVHPGPWDDWTIGLRYGDQYEPWFAIRAQQHFEGVPDPVIRRMTRSIGNVLQVDQRGGVSPDSKDIRQYFVSAAPRTGAPQFELQCSTPTRMKDAMFTATDDILSRISIVSCAPNPVIRIQKRDGRQPEAGRDYAPAGFGANRVDTEAY